MFVIILKVLFKNTISIIIINNNNNNNKNKIYLRLINPKESSLSISNLPIISVLLVTYWFPTDRM